MLQSTGQKIDDCTHSSILITCLFPNFGAQLCQCYFGVIAGQIQFFDHWCTENTFALEWQLGNPSWKCASSVHLLEHNVQRIHVTVLTSSFVNTISQSEEQFCTQQLENLNQNLISIKKIVQWNGWYGLGWEHLSPLENL